MAVVMIQRGSGRGGGLPGDGQYLQSMDFEAHGGQGDIVLTQNLAKAKRFADLEEAWNFWRTQPICKPMRDYGDHGPNRPLTAANWEFKNID